MTGARAVAGAAPARSRSLSRRVDPVAVSAWILPFALVLYLALERGGYDPVVRGQVGLVAWWIVLLGALVGVLPAARPTPRTIAAVGLLTAFAVWTGLSATWTESQERTIADLGKVAAYGGVFVLVVSVAGGRAARLAVDGLASAIGVVAALAVLSRLQPQLFPSDDLVAFFGEGAARRLSYPLNYWNALACFVAMGAPLLLRAASDARTLAGQAVAAAAVPVLALAAYLTVSRGGALTFAVAVAAWFLLTPGRLARLPTLATCAAGAVILVLAADQRDQLQTGLPSAAASAQGDELLLMAIVVCLGVGLVQLGLGTAMRHLPAPRWASIPPARARIGALVAVLLVAGLAIAAGAPGTAEREWNEFKQHNPAPSAEGGEDAFARLQSVSGNGRYQYWEQTLEAAKTDPLKGIGSGTFEYWWARNTTYSGGFIRDAHSLYMETLGELGIVGLLLIAGLLLLAIGSGITRAFGPLPAERRSVYAAATAALLAFAAGAALEWVWEIGALAIAALVLVAVLCGRSDDDAPAAAGTLTRGAMAVLALAGVVAVVVPLAGAAALHTSRDEVQAGELARGFEQAKTVTDVQPYSASGYLQQALIYERAGAIDRALDAARTAAAEEPTNWRPWLIVSRLAARDGDAAQSVRAYRKAKRLNPRSGIFNRP